MKKAAFLPPVPVVASGRPKHARHRCQRLRPVAGVTQRIAELPNGKDAHPVLEVLQHRLNTASKPGRRKDDRKVALCIEGGGMRGAVSAGMVAALKYIGLEDSFDVVYGSSAGAIVGAYFLSRQLPMYGAQIYYDIICSIPENGQRFIDLWALRHHPYLRLSKRKRSQFYPEGARPVLLLDRLIDDVMRYQRPLNWDAFQKMHTVQPLKPVASSLLQMCSHTLEDFSNLDEFLECLRASARVPGIAGNPVEINGDLYADGLMFEPIPYRSALQDGCTDVLVLRTKPDSFSQKPMKPGVYEKHIASPYFDMVPNFAPRAPASDYLISGHHIALYNDDLERLRMEKVTPFCYGETAIYSVTPPVDVPEVGQLESRARHVYEGVRNGFAAAYDALSPFAGRAAAIVQTDAANETAKRKRRPRLETAGSRASRWVFSDEELATVEQRHKAARKTSAAKSKERRRREKKLREPAKRNVLKRARQPRRVGARVVRASAL